MQINQIPTAALDFNTGMQTPAIDISTTTASNINMPDLKMDNGLFGISNGTLQGIGTLAGVLGGLWSASRQADYQDKMYKEEKRRVAREEKRQDKFESAMKKAYR